MPLPLTISCFSKIQIGFTFLVPAHPGTPGQRAVKRVCVCSNVADHSGGSKIPAQFSSCADVNRPVLSCSQSSAVLAVESRLHALAKLSLSDPLLASAMADFSSIR